MRASRPRTSRERGCKQRLGGTPIRTNRRPSDTGNGDRWTEQSAPLPQPQGASVSPVLLLAIIGALAAAIGVFLPRVDSPTSLHIADNSIIASDLLVGLLVLVGAVGTVASAIQNQRRSHRDAWLEAAGLLILGAAIYYGTGDRLDLETTNVTGAFGSGISIDGSPGVGLYVMGLGGVFLAVAGYLVPGLNDSVN